jgi:hypothetical protein
MNRELEKTGAEVRVLSSKPLPLESDKEEQALRVAEFQPEAILVLLPREGTMDRQGRHLLRRFDAGVFRYTADEGRRELLWRADITLRPTGWYLGQDDLQIMARDLVDRLREDGILAKSGATVGAGLGVAPAARSGPAPLGR